MPASAAIAPVAVRPASLLPKLWLVMCWQVYQPHEWTEAERQGREKPPAAKLREDISFNVSAASAAEAERLIRIKVAERQMRLRSITFGAENKVQVVIYPGTARPGTITQGHQLRFEANQRARAERDEELSKQESGANAYLARKAEERKAIRSKMLKEQAEAEERERVTNEEIAEKRLAKREAKAKVAKEKTAKLLAEKEAMDKQAKQAEKAEA